jgi:hypothetical protein
MGMEAYQKVLLPDTVESEDFTGEVEPTTEEPTTESEGVTDVSL